MSGAQLSVSPERCPARVVGDVERRRLEGREPKPADYAAVCAECEAVGWKLV